MIIVSVVAPTLVPGIITFFALLFAHCFFLYSPATRVFLIISFHTEHNRYYYFFSCGGYFASYYNVACYLTYKCNSMETYHIMLDFVKCDIYIERVRVMTYFVIE